MSPLVVLPVWTQAGHWQAVLVSGPTLPDPVPLDECRVPWWRVAEGASAAGLYNIRVIDFDPAMPPVPDTGEYVLRVDVSLLASAPLSAFLAQRAQARGLWLTGVDNRQLLSSVARHRPDAVFGTFWREPEVDRRGGVDRGILLRLLERVSADAADRELESLVSGSPSLLLGLLKLVNSASISGGRRIEGIGHALSILGRRQLQRWLLLLLYAERYQFNELFNPRLLMVCLRSRLMEMVCRHLGGAYRGLAELAFLTGMISLLELVSDVPREQLLQSLALAEPAEAALRDEGLLAPVLRLAEAAETGDSAVLVEALKGLGMNDLQWRKALQESWCWLAKLREEG